MTVNFNSVSFRGNSKTVSSTTGTPKMLQHIDVNPVYRYRKPNWAQKLYWNVSGSVNDLVDTANFRFRKFFDIKPKDLTDEKWEMLKEWDSAHRSKEVKRDFKAFKKLFKKLAKK